MSFYGDINLMHTTDVTQESNQAIWVAPSRVVSPTPHHIAIAMERAEIFSEKHVLIEWDIPECNNLASEFSG